MKTKYHNWKTTKNSNRAQKALEDLKKKHPDTIFELKANKKIGKDKTTYSVRTITRKGHKRGTSVK